MQHAPVHGKLLIVKRCLVHLCGLAKKYKPDVAQHWHEDIIYTWQSIVKRWHLPELQSTPLPAIVPHQSAWFRIDLAAKMSIKHIDVLAKTAISQRRAQRVKELSEKNNGPQGLTHILRALRDSAPGRLGFLKSEAGIVVDPVLVDQAARHAWDTVYRGLLPVESHWSHAAAFMHKHAHLIPQQEPAPLSPLTVERVLHEFRTFRPSASGPDGWGQADLSHMSPNAAHYLCAMYGLIEQGVPWPEQLAQAKAVFLAKSEAAIEPMEFRILTICSHLYRIWAAIRLGDISAWSDSWLDPGMYAGAGGRSASEASWLLSFEVEKAKACEEPISALSIDIFKCFDQVCRPILYSILQRLGAPVGVLAGWYNMMQQLSIYNCLSNSTGMPYHRACSIPQGCPFSMLWLCALTLPLARAARGLLTIPRLLADDITLFVQGRAHWLRLKRAGAKAFEIIAETGARVAHHKSALFSTSSMVRSHMRTHTWPHINDRVPVKQSARDLGAHVTFTKKLQSGTIVARIQVAVRVAWRLSSLAARAQRKVQAVHSKLLPLALYGCPSTPVPQAPVLTLSRAIKRAIALGNDASSSPLLLFCTWGTKNPDPAWHILVSRLRTLRLMWHKHQAIRDSLDELLIDYMATGAEGACSELHEPILRTPHFVGPTPWGPNPTASDAQAAGPSPLP